MNRIHIIDYGMANLGSIVNMIKHVGGESSLCSDPRELRDADVIILPGVGHFGEAMARLREGGWEEPLHESRERGAWILGICLGMQLMTRFSEEGDTEGLGWIPLDTIRFPDQGADGERLRIPHMGWNSVQWGDLKGHPIQTGLVDDDQFYFVHSYHVVSEDSTLRSLSTCYGYPFISGILHNNCLATQFHPEKSQAKGLQIYRNFLEKVVAKFTP